MHKVHNYPTLLPKSIRETIPVNSPVAGSNHESCANWLKIYNNPFYNKSVFFKGPLLLSGTSINENLPLASFIAIKLYKKNIKEALLSSQSSGDTDDWQNYNFVLYNFSGLRRSHTSYRSTVNYNDND